MKNLKTVIAFCCIGAVAYAENPEHWTLNRNWPKSSLVEKLMILNSALMEMNLLQKQADRGVFRLVISDDEVYLSNSSGESTLSYLGSWVFLPTASTHNGYTTDAILDMFPSHISHPYLLEEIFGRKGKCGDLKLDQLKKVKSLAIEHIPEAKKIWGEEHEKTEEPITAYKRSEAVISTEWSTKPDGTQQTIEKQIAILLDCCKRLEALSRAGFDNYCCLIEGNSVVIAVVDTKDASDSKETYEAMVALAGKLAVDYSTEGDSANITSDVLVAYLEFLKKAYLDSFPEQTIEITIPEVWGSLKPEGKRSAWKTIVKSFGDDVPRRLVITKEGKVYLSNITRSTFKMESVADWLCGDGSGYQEKNKTTWIEICGANDEEKTIGWLREVFHMPNTEAGLLWKIDITKDNIEQIRRSIRYY
ncbi:MAG: hypothetical protein ACSW8C_03830 [bacterium]